MPRAARLPAPWDPPLCRLGRQSLCPQAPLPEVLSRAVRPTRSVQALAAYCLHGRSGTATAAAVAFVAPSLSDKSWDFTLHLAQVQFPSQPFPPVFFHPLLHLQLLPGRAIVSCSSLSCCALQLCFPCRLRDEVIPVGHPL